MERNRIIELFNQFKNIKVAVIGDFFLDKYLVIDTRLNEPSIETKLTAYQVVKTREYPGASGTVTNNLSALGVGEIYAVGFVGNDGNGYELKRELDKMGVNRKYLFETDYMVTPTYTKPMMLENGIETESNRQDIKNFKPTDRQVENRILNCLDEVFENNDAIIILDQMVENDCGVITGKIRDEIIRQAGKQGNKIIFADSRARIHLFKDISIKCNNFEVCRAFNSSLNEEPEYKDVLECGEKLYEQNRRPAFVTLGRDGMVTFGDMGTIKVPTADVPRPYDICGAGDSVTASVVSALAAGANQAEAAFIGNIVASITIRKIGVTGTASLKEVLETFDDYFYNVEYSQE
ncbi:MAG: carbohydrate kinase [Clostridia bacterium]|nr:carbohydrate kinase [Clostridia bacterium]